MLREGGMSPYVFAWRWGPRGNSWPKSGHSVLLAEKGFSGSKSPRVDPTRSGVGRETSRACNLTCASVKPVLRRAIRPFFSIRSGSTRRKGTRKGTWEREARREARRAVLGLWGMQAWVACLAPTHPSAGLLLSLSRSRHLSRARSLTSYLSISIYQYIFQSLSIHVSFYISFYLSLSIYLFIFFLSIYISIPLFQSTSFNLGGCRSAWPDKNWFAITWTTLTKLFIIQSTRLNLLQ